MRPSRTAAAMVAIVVRQHHFRRFLGGLRAFVAHGDAHIGALEGGRVIDAVSRHRDDRAVRLQRLDQPKFMLGAGAGENGCRRQGAAKRRVVHRVDRVAGERVDGALAQAQLARDRGPGRGVIAGDHLDVDPRRLAFGDRLNRFRPRRVDQTDKAEQRESALFDIGQFETLDAACRLRGEGDDALAARRKLVDRGAPPRGVQLFVAGC
jgi:hypothetical protein